MSDVNNTIYGGSVVTPPPLNKKMDWFGNVSVLDDVIEIGFDTGVIFQAPMASLFLGTDVKLASAGTVELFGVAGLVFGTDEDKYIELRGGAGRVFGVAAPVTEPTEDISEDMIPTQAVNKAYVDQAKKEAAEEAIAGTPIPSYLHYEEQVDGVEHQPEVRMGINIYGVPYVQLMDNVTGEDLLLKGVENPEDETDGANKRYVDQIKEELAPKFQGHFKVWQPNTKYAIDDWVIANVKDEDWGEITCVLKCEQTHTSSNNIEQNLYSYWEVSHLTSLNSFYADKTSRDSEGNVIHETYATKEEIGNINEALEAVLNGGN